MRHSRLPIPFAGTIDLSSAQVDVAPEPSVSAEMQRSLAQHEGAGALVFGRLRFLDAPAEKALRDPAKALLDAWRQHGDDVLARIGGEFLVALWDADRRRALLAVDRFSTFPLFFSEQPGRVGFAARPADAANRADRAAEVDWQSAFAYTYFHMIPAPWSICRGVYRLDLGEALRVERGSVEVVRWWEPVFEEHRAFDFEREKGAFLDALAEGVAECTAGHSRDSVGCFLSGGTDSSTIAGLVTKQYGAPARTFAIGFDVGGYDESYYSRLAAKHFGTEHTEYYLTPDDVSRGVELVATQYEQPFGNSSAVPTYFCAQLAREAGVSRMLGGDGGDELYGGNERYAKQAVFALYDRVPGAMRSGLLEPLLFGAMRGVDAKFVAKARSYVEQAKEPLPDRLQARYNLLNRLGATRVFTDAFLADLRPDAPLELEREVWRRARATAEPISQVDQLLAWDFKFTLADSDLPKVTRMCHAAGVEVCFPMLTQALVEHSLRLTPEQKLKGRRLRHFFREALRGFLPDEIIDKKKHGFGVPFGDWLLTHERLRATADDALRSLAARGVVRPEFLDTLLGHLRSGHAGYYGTMVWVLMVLELWLRASPLADARVGPA